MLARCIVAVLLYSAAMEYQLACWVRIPVLEYHEGCWVRIRH